MPDRLDDQWHTRDRPALVELADLFATNPQTRHTNDPETVAAVLALSPTYLDATVQRIMGGQVHSATIHGLTDRGRREVGLWPDEQAAAGALLELITQAADTTTDPDDAGALRKAGRLLKSVPSDILADIAAALIRQQTGIG